MVRASFPHPACLFHVPLTFSSFAIATISLCQGRTDWKKYETARKLHKHVDKIRKDYTKDLKSKLVWICPSDWSI